MVYGSAYVYSTSGRKVNCTISYGDNELFGAIGKFIKLNFNSENTEGSIMKYHER
jgi:hypothetical protein